MGQFDLGARGYSSTNAYWLGQAARLAYRDSAMIEAAIAPWGFSQFQFFDQEATQAFLISNAELTILAFRGTQQRCWRDWTTDLKIKLVPGCGGKVHCGFLAALDRIWDELMSELAKHHRSHQALWITGHSLGAALATLAASRLHQSVNAVYTFGSPRVGDRQFSDRFERLLGDRTFRLVNDEDLVTRVPPRVLGYRHVGEVLYFDQAGVLRQDEQAWRKFLDRVHVSLEDLLEPGEGFRDHNMEVYAKLLALNVPVAEGLGRN